MPRRRVSTGLLQIASYNAAAITTAVTNATNYTAISVSTG